jgi:hypothetical protein
LRRFTGSPGLTERPWRVSDDRSVSPSSLPFPRVARFGSLSSPLQLRFLPGPCGHDWRGVGPDLTAYGVSPEGASIIAQPQAPRISARPSRASCGASSLGTVSFGVVCVLLSLVSAGPAWADDKKPSKSSPTEAPRLAKPDAATRASVSAAYGKLPLMFEANTGQTDSKVKFLSRGSGYSLFLTAAEVVLASHSHRSRAAKGHL